MKKQILILVLAIFAIGFSSTAFGQLAPQALTCIDLNDPLNVVAGQPYTYEITVPTPPGSKTYHWFVTQDEDMIENMLVSATIEPDDGTGSILATGSGSYNDVANTLDEVTLTFKSFTLAADEYVFLGILVENTDNTGVGCTTNNFKVYRILPVHAFTLDIANVDDAGVIQGGYGTDNLTTCMADILTASFDPVNDAMAYDFNENVMYYAVAAANFSGSYELTLTVASLTAGQTVTIDWGTTFGTFPNNIAPATSPNGDYPTVIPAVGGSVGAAGETIYIRVLIDHDTQFEGNAAANIPYTLAANGVLVDGSGNAIPGLEDINHLTCVHDDTDDVATQLLIPRPVINSDNPPAPGYLPIAP